jgi:hypothetical protein
MPIVDSKASSNASPPPPTGCVRIDLSPYGMQVRLRAAGLQTLVEELQSRGQKWREEARGRWP